MRGQWEERFEERIELLLSWRHTGFSVHNRVRVEPEDQPAVERLARYIMRPPISLERVQWGGDGEVSYRPKGGHDGRALRRSWAQLIKRVSEVDPLVCPKCQGEMRIIAFIIDHEVVDKILRHLAKAGARPPRGPPSAATLFAAS